MRIPFEPRFVDQRGTADGYFADAVGEGVLGAYGAEEGVPAWVGWSVSNERLGGQTEREVSTYHLRSWGRGVRQCQEGSVPSPLAVLSRVLRWLCRPHCRTWVDCPCMEASS